ncbi:hypothetical protein BXU06_04565 [Aquaspirillum sp. LM1]|nr:hypothetical protein BXU06_04565 [Aquaspirillum sp. LM1]
MILSGRSNYREVGFTCAGELTKGMEMLETNIDRWEAQAIALASLARALLAQAQTTEVNPPPRLAMGGGGDA